MNKSEDLELLNEGEEYEVYFDRSHRKLVFRANHQLEIQLPDPKPIGKILIDIPTVRVPIDEIVSLIQKVIGRLS